MEDTPCGVINFNLIPQLACTQLAGLAVIFISQLHRATMKPMEPVPECAVFEQERGEFTVSTDVARLDIDVIHGYLARAYWSNGITREIVERAVQHSLCFGLFEGETQIGFARAVTDSTTFAYICDVFVLESHQG
jgi:hypothetical protein